MNYKKIFRNRENRMKILRMLKWIPDSWMVRFQYRIQLGMWPDLNNPRRFTEKLQLYKLKYRNPLMCQCVDKYDVREYVKNKGLGHILNECYGVYDSAEEIDLASLPQQFVAKTTDGGGGFNIKIVKDKSELDETSFRTELNSWLGIKDINPGREWAYTGIKKSRIILEKMLKQNEMGGGSLYDYKFFCFDGEVKFLYFISDRKDGVVSLAILDPDFNRLPYSRADEKKLEYNPIKPEHYDEMLEIAKKLSQGFPHVRVDLYNINGIIIFGELTFYDGSGYFHFTPDEYDFIAGGYFQLK